MSKSNLPAASLTSLAERINAAHEAAEGALRQSVQHALEAGRLLIEAKGLLSHGEWTCWLSGNFRGSHRTAQLYMRLAEHWPLIQAKAPEAAQLTFRQAIEAVTDRAEKAKERCEAKAVETADENANPVVDELLPVELGATVDEAMSTVRFQAEKLRAIAALIREAEALREDFAELAIRLMRDAGFLLTDAERLGYHDTMMQIVNQPETPEAEVRKSFEREQRRIARRKRGT